MQPILNSFNSLKSCLELLKRYQCLPFTIFFCFFLLKNLDENYIKENLRNLNIHDYKKKPEEKGFMVCNFFFFFCSKIIRNPFSF